MADYGTRAYDRFMAPLERLGLRVWRQQLLHHVEPPVLEVGIGTGASLRWYNGHSLLTAIDRQGEMAWAARERALALGSPTAIVQMDAQYLGFPDATFASAVTNLVFCSVVDPVRELRQIRRVLRPGGDSIRLEHGEGGFVPMIHPVEPAPAEIGEGGQAAVELGLQLRHPVDQRLLFIHKRLFNLYCHRDEP